MFGLICFFLGWIFRSWQIPSKTSITMQIEGIVRDNLVTAAKSLFSDNPCIWPLHLTMYYLGQIPDLDVLIPHNHRLDSVTLMRLKTHLSSDWHTSSIRLAGRIFGDYQKRMAIFNNIPLKPLSPSSRTFISNSRWTLSLINLFLYSFKFFSLYTVHRGSLFRYP